MINDIIKDNWIEMALRQFDGLVEARVLPAKPKPNKQLIGGLISHIFSNEKFLTSGPNWVDLSSVSSDNFFEPRSKELIISRLGKGIAGKTPSRVAVFHCLRKAYEEGFDIHKAIPKLEQASTRKIPAKNTSTEETPAKKTEQYNLVDEWEKAVFFVFDNEPKFDDIDSPAPEAVQSQIKSIIESLEKDFGKISYKEFVTNDDIMEKTDELLAEADEKSETLAELHIIKAMEIAVTKLPVPRP